MLGESFWDLDAILVFDDCGPMESIAHAALLGFNVQRSVVGEGAVVTHSGQPGEPTEDLCSEPVQMAADVCTATVGAFWFFSRGSAREY